MATTYTLISSNVLSTTASSVTFSAIPSTYKDLVLRFSARSNAAGVTDAIGDIRINGATTSLYSNVTIYGDGASAASYLSSSATYIQSFTVSAANATSNTFGSVELYLPNYTSTTQFKPVGANSAAESNATTATAWYWNGATAGLYRESANAITEINIAMRASGSSFVSGSSFYLYGIKNS
jgi:hypothetical protein